MLRIFNPQRGFVENVEIFIRHGKEIRIKKSKTQKTNTKCII